MSQESRISSASTIPYELIEYQDSEFIEELEIVDQLYFQSTFGQFESSNINCDETLDELVENVSEVNFESDTDNDVEPDFDLTACDQKEYLSQSNFRRNSCGCKEFYGKPCSEVLNFDKLVEHREYCNELSHDELDLIVKAQLSAHRRAGSETQAKKHKPKDRTRAHQKYFFNGHQICRQTFCFAHSIERHKLQAIAKSLDDTGMSPRVHGNTRSTPKHSLTYDDRQRVKTFLCKYARDNALPLPGRLPNFKESCVLVLPSDKSVSDIHQLYQTTAESMSFRCISLRSFQRLWQELCPYITISKPATDLCQKCQDYCHKLASGGLLSDVEKTQLLSDYTVHVSVAGKQREYYKEQCQSSKRQFIELQVDKQEGNPPCSVDGEFHYSWDYAQQVHYPHHSQQCGPIFFKTPRKCSVFGICSEGSGRQVFYLADEVECAGKGANSVASMAHHYFHYHGHGEKHLKIHFDNCQGQNKNNIILWYSMWRVLQGLHESVELSMMIAGHTKFEPDWHFGLWKRRWRNSNVETMIDIASTVEQSSKSGHNKSQLIQDGEKPVVFYEWRDFLSLQFKPLKNITKYHHFYMNKDQPGIVSCRIYVDSTELSNISIVRKGCGTEPSSQMPEITPAPVMDAGRQWYLYEQIRQFCTAEKSKDICCPKPTVCKTEINLESGVEKCRKMPLSGKRKSMLLC